MSDTDSFIDEVSEEVRRDRLFALFRRYGWIPVLVIILVVGGAAWNEYRKATATAAAQKLGDAVISALSLPDADARTSALADIQPGDAAATAAVVSLVSAAAYADAGDIRAADDVLIAITTNGDVPVLYRDLAMLKRLFLNGNGLNGDDRAALIETLSIPGRPFRTLAREQRALMLIDEGSSEGAIEIYTELLNDNESTPQLISRARQMIIVLGGSLDAG